MKRLVLILLSCLFICPAGVARAAEPVPGEDKIHIYTEKHVLPNGLTVLLTEMPASHSVSLYALVKTGSALEGAFVGAGMTHFIEHMLFKGTDKRQVGDISGEIQALGGGINASTSFDYTVYTVTVPADGFDKALDILSDMLCHAKFDPEEVEKEREVIVKEMRLRDDHPGYYLGNKLFETVYVRHPYRLPIIGYEDVFRKITRDDLWGYYHDFYTPNNMIFSVAGNIDAKAALQKIQMTFKGVHRGRYLQRSVPQDPEQMTPRRYEEEYPSPLTRMSIAYTGVDFLHEDMPALDVLSMILGQGESSRLYRVIFQEKKLVRSISSWNYTPIDRGMFSIDSTLDYENVEKTITAVEEQVDVITREGVDKEELEKTKRQVLSSTIREYQKSGAVAFRTAAEEYMTADPEFSKKYIEMIKRVTNEDIVKVARKYLRPEKQSVVIIKPESAREEKPAAAGQSQVGEIRKEVFPNGCTVLLRENHNFPLVTLMVSMKGGTRFESEALNGLSELTARAWVKGTTSRSADEIAKQVESLGASFGSFSGRNSLGMKMSLLSEDLDFGLDLLQEAVRHPSFEEETIKKEKEKLATAILSRDDNISSLAMKALQQDLFETPGFRFLSLGTLESVENITRKDVLNFYKRVCVPENMVVSVYGDIDAESVLKDLKKYFASMPEKAWEDVVHEEKPVTQQKEKTIYVDKEQAMVVIGFHGTNFSSEDRYGLQVLAGILGSSFSGRIFNQIREELGQAYTLGGRFIPGLDTGMLYFGVQTGPDQAEVVKEKLIEIIKEIQEEEIPLKELTDMKFYIKGTFLMGMETDGEVIFATSLDELYKLGYDNYKGFDQAIDGVQPEYLRELAREYLDLDKAVIVTALPKGRPDEELLPTDSLF